MNHTDPSLPQDLEQLRAMLLANPVQCAELVLDEMRRLTQFEKLAAQQQVVVDSQHTTIKQLNAKITGLQKQLAQLLRKQYGTQRERIDPNQLTLFTDEELLQIVSELKSGIEDSVPSDDGTAEDNTPAEADPTPDTAAADNKPAPKKKSHGRRPLPEHLPRETIEYKLSDEERICPCCGKLRKDIGVETSSQLEYIPASLKVIVHERHKYACEDCEEHVSVAPKPPQPIERGLPGPGLLAHTILSKYGDYLPLYRQEDILSRSGIVIRRSTLCDWVSAAADTLEPLYQLLGIQVRESNVIHSDDTSIKLLESPHCRNCKFWIYAGDRVHPYSVFEFSLTRAGAEPSRFLEDYEGYLQTDGYSGYEPLFSEGKVKYVGCLAHCRRYWYDARESDSKRAHHALGYIGRLYALEAEFELLNLEGDALREARQKQSIPILNQFETWLRAEHPLVLPKSPIGEAFTYTLNQWNGLCRYTESGILSIDNNLAERLMKLPAIGRKNFLFVGSEEGGRRAAIIMSIISSAKLCQVEPLAYITDLLRELPLRMKIIKQRQSEEPEAPPMNDTTNKPDSSGSKSELEDYERLSDLLPDKWLSRHPEHAWEIDKLREEERDRTQRAKFSR